ncbi:MAG: TIGR00266 family protein [bacterium]
MDFEISHDPAYSLLQTDLKAGESLLAEADAMVSMDPEVDSDTALAGGFLSAMFRKLGGESMFINTFTGPGRLSLAPAVPGKIKHRRLENESFLIQAGAFLASDPGISLKTKWGGLKTIFGGEGATLLEANGTGDLFYNAFGEIYEVDVKGTYTCDTGHMVGFEPGLDYSLKTSGGFISTLFSGEGLVFKFEGNGKLYMQTRHLSGLADWLTPFLPD